MPQNEPEKNPMIHLDIVHALKVLPNEDPNKPLFGAICCLGLCTGMRAISFANLCFGDITRYRRIPNTNQHEFLLNIRVIKGNRESDLVVRLVDDMVGDGEAQEMTYSLCTNVVYWFELFLKKRYNMLLSDVENLSDEWKSKAIFQKDEHQLYTFIRNIYEKVLEYPHGYFCFHSLRSGFITSVLLHNTNNDTGVVNANVLHASRIGQWTANSDNMIHYLKNSHGNGIAANSIVFNRSTPQTLYTSAEEYHGIKIAKRINNAHYFETLFENSMKFISTLGYNSCILSTSEHNKGLESELEYVSKHNFVDIFRKREKYIFQSLIANYFNGVLMQRDEVSDFLLSNRDFNSFQRTGDATKLKIKFIGLLCANGIGQLSDYIFDCYKYAITRFRYSKYGSDKLSFLWHDYLLFDDDSELSIRSSFEIAMDAYQKQQYIAVHSEEEMIIQTLWILGNKKMRSNRFDCSLDSDIFTSQTKDMLRLYIVETHDEEDDRVISYIIGVDMMLLNKYESDKSPFGDKRRSMVEIEDPDKKIPLRRNYDTIDYNKYGEDISSEAVDDHGEIYTLHGAQSSNSNNVTEPIQVFAPSISSSSSSSNRTPSSSVIKSRHIVSKSTNPVLPITYSNSRVQRLEWTEFMQDLFYYVHDIFSSMVFDKSSSMRYKLCSYVIEHVRKQNNTYGGSRLGIGSIIVSEMQCRNKYQNDKKLLDSELFNRRQEKAKQTMVELRNSNDLFDKDMKEALEIAIKKHNKESSTIHQINIESLSQPIVNEKIKLLNGNRNHSFQITESKVVDGDITFACKFSPTKQFRSCVRNNTISNEVIVSGNELLNGEEISPHFKKILQALITHVVTNSSSDESPMSHNNNADVPTQKDGSSSSSSQRIVISSEMEQALTLTSTAARKIPVIIAETPCATGTQSQDFFIDLCQSDDDNGGNHSKKRDLELSSTGTLTSGTPNKHPRFIDLINEEEYDTVPLDFTQQPELNDAGDDRKRQFYELFFDIDGVDIDDHDLVFLEQTYNRVDTPVGICVQEALNHYYGNMQS